MDRYVLGSDTERVKLEGNLKQNNFYSGSLILWTYSRYRLWQVSPHNRDVRPNIYPWPNIQYTLSTKCVSKLNTQHSSPLRKYVHASTYIQGILRTTLLFHATPLTPSLLTPTTLILPLHTHPSPTLLTIPPHTHTSHHPSSHPQPSPSLLTHTPLTLPPPTTSLLAHSHPPHLPFSHIHHSTPLPPHLHSSSRRYRRPVGFLAISSRQTELSVKETASHTMPSRMYSSCRHTNKHIHTYVQRSHSVVYVVHS